MEFKVSFDWGKKKSATTQQSLPELWGDSIFYPTNYSEQNDRVLISMYNDLPEIQAPVNYVVDALTNIPYKHIRNNKDVDNSNIINVLDNPNQYQTENDFIKMFFLNRIMLGIGYINKIQPTGFRSVKQLYVLPTQYTCPNLENESNQDIRLNKIVSYTTSFNGSELVIDADEVAVQMETSLIDNNYYYTRSRFMSALMSSDTLRANYEARLKSLIDRGAMYIISPSDQGSTLTPTEAKQMRQKYHEENGITGNKFPGLISPRGLNVSSTSLNIGELELTANQQRDMAIICNIIGIDPAIFGIGNNTYNNKKLAKTAMYEDTVMPLFNNYLQLLSKSVFKLPKNESLKADYSQITAMQEDYDKVVVANSKLYTDGAITQEEYRENAGFQGGEDKYKIQVDQESSKGTETE